MKQIYLVISFCVLLILCAIKAQSQQSRLDSLHIELKTAQNDLAKLEALRDLYSYYAESNRDSSMYFNEMVITLAEKINQPLWKSGALLGKAYLMQKQSNYSLSIKYCNEALAIIENEKNETGAIIPTDSEFANDPSKYRKSLFRAIYHQLGNTWRGAGNNEKAIEYYKKVVQVVDELNSKDNPATSVMNIGTAYIDMGLLDSAFIYSKRALEYANIFRWRKYRGVILRELGRIYLTRGLIDSAKYYFNEAVAINREQNNLSGEIATYNSYAELYRIVNKPDSMLFYASTALRLGYQLKWGQAISASAANVALAWELKGKADSALVYLKVSKIMGDSVAKDFIQNLTKFQTQNFEDQLQLEKQVQESVAAKNRARTMGLIVGLVLLSVLVFVFYRNNVQKQKVNQALEKTLLNLKATQTQLIQSEKMASLGELTAGIAHEIQNPLNFVNNFSEVNTELIKDLKSEIEKGNTEEVKSLAKDIESNEEKINHHGKRADAIVKSMLQHSSKSSGQKELTDINALCDEYLLLSYHGYRAKDKSFNAKFETNFDSSLPKINVLPQEIGRVILNLINNAFYAVNEKAKTGTDYEPQVIVATKNLGNKIEIAIKDNGNGIPDSIKEKIFQPFFTTKPTGQGTGLGLSLSYDIVKAHGGEIRLESEPGMGSSLTIQLPINT